MWKVLIELVSKWACKHDWGEPEMKCKVHGNDSNYYYQYTYICKKCGEFKQITIGQ